MKMEMTPLESLLSGGKIIISGDMPVMDPQEAELSQVLIALTQKYGKFDEKGEGVWAGYDPPSKNTVKNIGVKCSNCVLYEGGTSCKIIATPVMPDGKCRFAVIPNGVVKKSK
jgi:hypothetical protein